MSYQRAVINCRKCHGVARRVYVETGIRTGYLEKEKCPTVIE